MLSTFLQQLINGISQGSAYALIALGYTMVYGVLGLINFAHSDVYMFGAFMGYYIANNRVVQEHLGTSLFAAVIVMVLSMALSAVLGIAIAAGAGVDLDAIGAGGMGEERHLARHVSQVIHQRREPGSAGAFCCAEAIGGRRRYGVERARSRRVRPVRW